ncbi:MAG: hypothetical protein H6577_01215 [Lewinellaceae bacterium]|nr:hypothetical protein [Saprospiraceae bacterium]MCB9336724.1 hypothetical protein [Lewinellaceae bacterium]
MNNFFKKLFAILFGVFFALFLLELACQALFAFMVAPQLKSQQNDPLHYYTASDDPALSYVLKPGYQIEKDGRSIHINQYGIRDNSEDTGGPRKVALLGDSVPFGIALSQDETPPAALQRMAGDSIRILNFGTPGYGLEEVKRYLEVKYPIYKPEKLYYFLNLNDFSKRNTIYEGGDNGLYRIYEKPFFKLPFFIRKAVYRYIKEGKMSTSGWYRWMFKGNNRELLPLVKQMSDYAKANGSEFTVLLFPPAVAYENGQFVLQDVFDEISQYLKQNNIPVIAPVSEFSQNTYDLQDNTDHFTAKGSEVIAGVVWKDLTGGR